PAEAGGSESSSGRTSPSEGGELPGKRTRDAQCEPDSGNRSADCSNDAASGTGRRGELRGNGPGLRKLPGEDRGDQEEHASAHPRTARVSPRRVSLPQGAGSGDSEEASRNRGASCGG